MKKFLMIALACSWIALPVLAEEQVDTIGPLVITDVSIGSYTAATDQVTSELYANGWCDSVFLAFSGASNPTVDVDVVTSTNTFFQERDIITLDDVTASGVYPVRIPTVSAAGSETTNDYSRIPLVVEKIKLRVYSANKTNITVRAWLIKTRN